MTHVVYVNGGYAPDDGPNVSTSGDVSGATGIPTHSHSESDVTSLVSDLAAKSASTHTHTATEVVATFTLSGSLSAAAGALKVPAVMAYTLTGVRLAVGTAPVGAAILVDVNKNGTTVFTTQGNRATIADGASSGGPGTAPDVTSVAVGDLLSMDVDQIGSGTAGSNLVVAVLGTRTIS